LPSAKNLCATGRFFKNKFDYFVKKLSAVINLIFSHCLAPGIHRVCQNPLYPDAWHCRGNRWSCKKY